MQKQALAFDFSLKFLPGIPLTMGWNVIISQIRMGCDVSLARKVLPSSMLVLEYFVTVTKMKLGKKDL